MLPTRVPETNCPTLTRDHVEAYDRMQRRLRENGWLNTSDILESGITRGTVLEVGSGPGYLGLEWLQRTADTCLVGLDMNPEMIDLACKHAEELGLGDRARYVLGFAEAMPFNTASFDALFSSNSLHEWLDPSAILAEFLRVLKPGGRLYLSDLRRDLPRSARNFLQKQMLSDSVRESLVASINAAYNTVEATDLLRRTAFAGCGVTETALGLRITGFKPFHKQRGGRR